LHLGPDGIDLRGERFHPRLGALQRVLGGGVFLHQAPLARLLQLGKRQLRLLVGKLRLLVAILRPVGIDARLKDSGIDFGEQIPRFHRVADGHLEHLQLT
jgi:hypothetical protein